MASGHWLLGAAEDRDRAQDAWQVGGVAMLRCGGLFSAVRIPEARIHDAVLSRDRAEIDRSLAQRLEGGPVICDRFAGWYYALVPASVARRWETPDTVCLGVGSLLGVPEPETVEDSGHRIYWSVPMDSPATLCHPSAVSGTITAGVPGAVSR
ncbi:hypothetical protein ACFWR6_06525 [Streptomyces griseus]|uniref:hypothetical protein n=1 Tax=Streptomyces griseus TaxID=1911 RepID=UPI0036690FF4